MANFHTAQDPDCGAARLTMAAGLAGQNGYSSAGRGRANPPRLLSHDSGTSTHLTAEDVMTAQEVASLLHSRVSTVEDWARRGVLPSVKVGRRRLYIRQQVEATLLDAPAAQRSR
jgi:excisionase family DNA binding protein